jgi:hypothetical protein
VGREGMTVRAGTVKWVYFLLALAGAGGPAAGWYLSQSSSKAAVEAVVGETLKRHDQEISELKAEISTIRVENNAIRSEIARVGQDVAWIRGRLEAGARLGSGSP